MHNTPQVFSIADEQVASRHVPTLSFSHLVLSNLPSGPESAFPLSLLLVSFWPLGYNRSLAAAAASTVLVCQDVLFVVPSDQLDCEC